MWTALAILLAAAVRIRLLNIPLERDEGEYAYLGQLMLQGIPPYKLAYGMKFPGTYAAYAAIMAVFGQTIAGIHVGLLLVNAGCIVLIYLLGKRLFTPAAGAAASVAYALLSLGQGIHGTQAHATHFVVLAALAGTVLLLRGIDTGRLSTLFWSGALYGISVLMKQHGAVFLVFGAAYLVWDHFTNRRDAGTSLQSKLGSWLVGAASPLVLTGMILWRAGVFANFWFWTVTYARNYASEATLPEGLTEFRAVFPRVVGPNLAIWMLALAGLVLIWWKNRQRASTIFLSGFLLFSILAVCPGLYFREHYFVLLLPALALLAGAAVATVRQQWPHGAWRWYALFGAIVLFSIASQHAFLFQMNPSEASRAMYGPNPFPEAIQIAAYIQAHSAKDARILVLGSEPEIPFYADRHSATGHIYMYNLVEYQPFAFTMQDELIRDAEASRPDFVVVVNVPTSWLRRPYSPTRIFDWWSTYGPPNYKSVGVADIVSLDRTEYRWENVDSYQRQSRYSVEVYQRRDLNSVPSAPR